MYIQTKITPFKDLTKMDMNGINNAYNSALKGSFPSSLRLGAYIHHNKGAR